MPPANDHPGVGQLTALAFTAAIDDPGRFRRSRDLGAYLGLVPRRYQSGEIDYVGGISKVGDRRVRTLLYEAANVIGAICEHLTCGKSPDQVAGRRPFDRLRTGISFCCPGPRMKRTGRPSASTTAWILVPNPPRDRPSAWAEQPKVPAMRSIVGKAVEG